VRFSIVIPARNEAAYLGKCLDAIRTASRLYAGQVEIIVVLNRCTDSTEAIALECGAKLVRDDSRNLAKIRNAGARQARGEILVTVDADSVMSANMLEEIDRKLSSGKYIGGGVPVLTERFSLGILVTMLLIGIFIFAFGLSGGLFWCCRSDFEALGGFDEALTVGEDINFAKRLRAYGRKTRRRFGTMWKTHITTSCRKFDRFGDWFIVKRPHLLWRAIHGIDDGFSDELFYDFKR
jgi:glycosyltransferase involved in cell wall biosynthesis